MTSQALRQIEKARCRQAVAGAADDPRREQGTSGLGILDHQPFERGDDLTNRARRLQLQRLRDLFVGDGRGGRKQQLP